MIASDTLSDLCQSAVGRISPHWRGGTLDWVKINMPMALVQISLTEATLDAQWIECRDRDGRLEDYQRALAAWETANMDAALAHEKAIGVSGG